MQHTLTEPNKSFRDLWDLVLLVAIAIGLAGLALWMVVSQYTIFPGSGPEQDPLMSQTAFAEETGIKIVSVSVVMAGGMIDLRYQVVDPDKAVIVHDEENPPGFIHEATGQLINTPYHDHSIFEAHTAINYHELIMNPGGVLKSGDKISVLIGETRLEHVVVQ